MLKQEHRWSSCLRFMKAVEVFMSVRSVGQVTINDLFGLNIFSL